jgi:RNA polymerase primary sigma factor
MHPLERKRTPSLWIFSVSMALPMWKKVMGEILSREIEEMLDKLPEKERRVVELRFGLRGEEPKTLREIGEILNISRERVRQLETRALRKLRNMAIKKHLKDFLST